MNKKAQLLIILLSISCMIIALSITLVWRYNATHFSCRGSYSAEYHDSVLHASAQITFNGNEGTAVLSGVLENGLAKSSNIVTSTVFSIKKVKKSFVMVATENTIESSGDEKELENIIPEFYYQTGSNVIYDIFPQGNGYLFVRGGLPVFFCAR